MSNDINKVVDNIVDNFKKDMALFESGSSEPATIGDIERLCTMTFYAISALAEVIKGN